MGEKVDVSGSRCGQATLSLTQSGEVSQGVGSVFRVDNPVFLSNRLSQRDDRRVTRKAAVGVRAA